MYGCGDVPEDQQHLATAIVLEDIIIEYIEALCLGASHVAQERAKRIQIPTHHGVHSASTGAVRRGRVRLDDFRYLLRNDPRKLWRINYLVKMDQIVAASRNIGQIVDDDGEGGAAANAGQGAEEERAVAALSGMAMLAGGLGQEAGPSTAMPGSGGLALPRIPTMMGPLAEDGIGLAQIRSQQKGPAGDGEESGSEGYADLSGDDDDLATDEDEENEIRRTETLPMGGEWAAGGNGFAGNIMLDEDLDDLFGDED